MVMGIDWVLAACKGSVLSILGTLTHLLSQQIQDVGTRFCSLHDNSGLKAANRKDFIHRRCGPELSQSEAVPPRSVLRRTLLCLCGVPRVYAEQNAAPPSRCPRPARVCAKENTAPPSLYLRSLCRGELSSALAMLSESVLSTTQLRPRKGTARAQARGGAQRGRRRREAHRRPQAQAPLPSCERTAGQTPKLARQASIELPSMAASSTKSWWETGEVQAQSAAKTPSCKDIVAGDMSKKSLWEQKGGSKTSSTIKTLWQLHWVLAEFWKTGM
ncbi:uncharacterized protein LOC100971766 [Pan paniscus]|nr:uncharacterized protein LOC100971766 [Pan paniscus]